MAKFNKTTDTEEQTPTQVEKGTARVTHLQLVNIESKPWLRGFANVIFDGTVYMQSIAVRENEAGEAYITFPSKKRMGKDGKPALDKDGKEIYDSYYGPADAATRTGIQDMIFAAVQAKLNGEETEKAEKGANKALVNLVENGKSGLVAFANVVYTGKVFMTGITINEVQNGEKAGEAYLGFPSRKRMKNGVEVLDENTGKPIYDQYFGPASVSSKEELENMIYPAVQQAMDEEANK